MSQARSRSWSANYASTGISRRRFLAGTAAGGAAVFVVACGGSGSSPGLKLDDSATSRQPGTVWLGKNDWRLADETGEAVRGGIFRGFRTADFLGHFDPIPQEAANSGAIGRHVYELLMTQNRGPGIEPGSEAYNNPVGALAESWEISADGTTYTFTLRPNVKFQNIAPVNGRVKDMDDWRTSHERHIAVSPYRLALGDTLDKVEYPDARHMVWKFKEPFAPLVDRIWEFTFAYFILPKELNANPSLAETTPIGTGFKQLDKYQPSVGVEFRKHPDYWAGDPFIERWHEPVIPEYANQYSQFVDGKVTNFTPTARDIMLLRRDAPQTVIVAEPISETQVCYHRWGKINPSAFAWKDERVRIAMRRSTDFANIAEFLSNKREFEANGIPIEISTMTHVMQHPAYWLNPDDGELGALSENYFYNVAEAKKLTSAAGYDSAISLPFYLSGTGEIPESNAVVVDSLRASGVFDIEPKLVPANEYRNNINVAGEFDGVQSQTCAAGADIDYHAFRDFHSKRIGGVPFPDSQQDALSEAQRKEVDFEKRVAIIKEIQMYQAQRFHIVPGRSHYTTFSIRWPWVHNSNYGSFATGTPATTPALGSHLHWLDTAMPNRDRAI